MKRVGIMRGGPGKNYEFSLQEGAEIIAHIFECLGNSWKPVDILIDRDSVWHELPPRADHVKHASPPRRVKHGR